MDIPRVALKLPTPWMDRAITRNRSPKDTIPLERVAFAWTLCLPHYNLLRKTFQVFSSPDLVWYMCRLILSLVDCYDLADAKVPLDTSTKAVCVRGGMRIQLTESAITGNVPRFIADPIINLYIEPLERIYPADIWEPDLLEELQTEGASSWFQHFAKGLASLGFLSFVKVFFAMSPWQWGGLRSFGLISSGGRSTGRNRVASISWAVILIGVCSFLWAVFKGVRAWCRRALEKAGERVMDVPLPDDEDEDEVPPSASNESSKKDK
ncbi:hypothetical protein Plec18167_002714 [Paecilomyces lecythidis]|uniref:Uncharacterized protein n=1 Tax=Paecilomyces lecythidis TaxID=3004212 RepID=A0ABR3Y7D1_9EURO